MTDIEKYLLPGAKGHFIGIGGVSMSPLAEVLAGMGLVICGSDMSENDNTKRLRAMGIDIKIGHRYENLSTDADFVVRTAAVHDDNPEIIAAYEAGKPVFERAQAWGELMRAYKNALCISGTHGKTTTTSMTTHILMTAQRDPTVMIGGTLPLLHAGHRIGKGDTIIMESCEYYNSFLQFSPTIAVILNIEADHLDFFKDLDDVKKSFRNFAALVPGDGFVITNADDKNSVNAVTSLERKIVTFGIGTKADVFARNISRKGIGTEFDVFYHDKFFTHVNLSVPGLHNVTNALAATASALCLGIDAESVSIGLEGFRGAERRFEYKGKINDALVYDDYAHHPGELRALLDAVETLGYNRVIVVFQPHTYSRTKALFDDFVEQLNRPDIVYLTEIYAAREKNTTGISSADLAKAIPDAQFMHTFEEVENCLRNEAKAGDIIITVGAGDVYKMGEALIEKLN